MRFIDRRGHCHDHEVSFRQYCGIGADVQVRCSFEVFGADFTGRIYVFAIVRNLVFGKIEAERPIFLPEFDSEGRPT